MAGCCLAGAGQIASWQGNRAGDSHFQWSQEKACLSPAPPTTSTTIIVLFYMSASPTLEQGLFSFQNVTLPHSCALHVVDVIV